MQRYISIGVKVRKPKRKNGNWAKAAFAGHESSGWKKEYGQIKRRRLVLEKHKNDALASARSMQALVNVTNDAETRRKARNDAAYFYQLHRKRQVINQRRKNGQKRGR